MRRLFTLALTLAICPSVGPIILSAQDGATIASKQIVLPPKPVPKPGDPPPGCGPTFGCYASLATRNPTGWQWSGLTLTNDEQVSLAAALAAAGRAGHVHMRLSGDQLMFTSDGHPATEATKDIERQPILKLGDGDGSRIRVLPIGDSYTTLKQRTKAAGTP